MATYFDSSSPGGKGPITASGQIYYFGAEVDFYIAVSSDTILGQSTGPSVQFQVHSRKDGRSDFQIDYSTTNTQFPVMYRGYLINCTVPAGLGSVSLRVVVSSEPYPLTVHTVAPATQNVNLTSDSTGIAAAVNNQWSNFVGNKAPKVTSGGGQPSVPVITPA